MGLMEKLSPMLKQYMDLKAEYPDTLVLFRLGDFYELFFDDAKIASYELDLVLTARAAGNNQKAPMCGVPFHAVSSYVKTLVNNGHKVAIVEQMEEAGASKGIVRRDVVRVVTPGTMTDEWVDDKTRNTIASCTKFAQKYTLALSELLSGNTQIEVIEAKVEDLKALIYKEGIKEIVLDSKVDQETLHALREMSHLSISYVDETDLIEEYKNNIKGIEDPTKIKTYGRLLNHLLKTQKRSLYHLREVVDEKTLTRMAIDVRSLQNLELITALRHEDDEATLFNFLDKARSAMGSRFLKDWIKEPYKILDPIIDRQNKIQSLLDDHAQFETLREKLSELYDLERLITKVSIRSAGPLDLLRLSKSLNPVPAIFNCLDETAFSDLKSVNQLNDLSLILNQALKDEVPMHVRDGDIFQNGYNLELDELRDIQKSGKRWLLEFEANEKDKTNIKNLKVGYNRVFGYYIEVSKGNVHLVKPEYEYTRKQTLSTGERYITPKLKEMEDKILHAQERALRLEQQLFSDLVDTVAASLKDLQKLADALASIDALQALTKVAFDHHYVRPSFNQDFDLNIKEGRHPILETKLDYVPNTTHFEKKQSIHLLTGPNMGGKSTYMRQVALIVVMAQMGSFVPAKSADLALVDAIYTRMGASDDILEGHSTFMLEMIEANHALKHATSQSLILFDEIGRGTSTFDGMALAQAMVEYVSTINQCKCIFSTHYHELTELEHSLNNLKNMHVDVHEENNEVTFLYRVKHGKAEQSYGVNVARLAHLPDSIIDRATSILGELESKKRVVQQSLDVVEVKHIPKNIQTLSDRLDRVDINDLTPMEALKLLDDFKKEFKD